MAAAAAASESNLPGRVDVIVTEIFDSQLLGEGLLPTLRDAVPRLLKVCENAGCGRRRRPQGAISLGGNPEIYRKFIGSNDA